MTIDQDMIRQSGPADRPSHLATLGLHPLQQAAMRLGDYRDGRSRLKAKDLVGLLLSHGARAWRSSQPVARVRVRVAGSSGGQAVSLRLPRA